MRVPRWLAETVVRAADATGVDPSYMMALADKESSLLPDNKAPTSSAEGLLQFVEARGSRCCGAGRKRAKPQALSVAEVSGASAP